MRSQMRLRTQKGFDVGSSSLTNGAQVFDTGSLNQRITFNWVSDFGSSQSWCIFQVRNSSATTNGYGYNFQKAVNNTASDYCLINTPSGQTNINGTGYSGTGLFVVQILGQTFSVTKNGSSIFSGTFNNASVESYNSTYCCVNTAGGTIANLYIEGL